MSTWIKLCGLSTPETVDTAVQCEVQAIGFVFAESCRRVTPELASKLALQIPAEILKVAVFLRPGQAEVDAVLAGFSPDVIQADVEALDVLNLPTALVPLPVYREGAADPITLPALPAHFLYEGAASGRGQSVDWGEAKTLAAGRNLILAGGLSPDNVSHAIASVLPFGVDVSSGIESSKGIKDPDLMRSFVDRVRNAEYSCSEAQKGPE